MKYITLPHIKDKQQEIPPLIFRFRYITRPQFQKLTNEKYQQNMNSRLKQLVNTNYLKFIWKESQKTKYTPAKYCLGNVGINYLKSLGYDEKALKKYYGDEKKSRSFQEKCIFIVDTFLSLFEQSKKRKDKFKFYTQADFKPDGELKQLKHDFGYVYESKTKVENYHCEIFDPLMVTGAIKQRLRRYFEFFSEWEEEAYIVFICPTDHIHKVVLKQTLSLLDQEQPGDNIQFSITTIERMRLGDIGEKIRIEN